MMGLKTRKGFSLIEIMLALAVIAIGGIVMLTSLMQANRAIERKNRETHARFAIDKQVLALRLKDKYSAYVLSEEPIEKSQQGLARTKVTPVDTLSGTHQQITVHTRNDKPILEVVTHV